LSRRARDFLCGLFNSFVVNYLVRLRVTTHVRTATVERLPIPKHDVAPSAFREIAALARLLSRRREPAALAALNARVAELYRLSAQEFAHVLATFPLVPVENVSAHSRFSRRRFGENACRFVGAEISSEIAARRARAHGFMRRAPLM
jgi:hypothetical protein